VTGADDRNPDWITYPLSELVRTMVLLLCQGYRDLDDADTLRQEAAFRLAVSERKGIAPLEVPERPEGVEPPRNPMAPEHLPSQPTLSRMTAMLSSKANRDGIRAVLLECAARRFRTARGGARQRRLTLDLDSVPVEVHGNQPEAEYNGHCGATIYYHPLVASIAETGDLLDLSLRRGSCHTAEGGLSFLLPILDRVEQAMCQVASVRVDAGFPEETFLAGLAARGTWYVARVRNNAVLDKMAGPHLRRPVGRRPTEPRTWFHEYQYKAKEWSRPRRVVLVVLEREDDLFLHHFWLITNRTVEEMDGEALLAEYRRRGTAERHQGELMNVLAPLLSSTVRPKESYAGRPIVMEAESVDAFAVNEVRLPSEPLLPAARGVDAAQAEGRRGAAHARQRAGRGGDCSSTARSGSVGELAAVHRPDVDLLSQNADGTLELKPNESRPMLSAKSSTGGRGRTGYSTRFRVRGPRSLTRQTGRPAPSPARRAATGWPASGLRERAWRNRRRGMWRAPPASAGRQLVRGRRLDVRRQVVVMVVRAGQPAMRAPASRESEEGECPEQRDLELGGHGRAPRIHRRRLWSGASLPSEPKPATPEPTQSRPVAGGESLLDRIQQLPRPVRPIQPAEAQEDLPATRCTRVRAPWAAPARPRRPCRLAAARQPVRDARRLLAGDLGGAASTSR